MSPTTETIHQPADRFTGYEHLEPIAEVHVLDQPPDWLAEFEALHRKALEQPKTPSDQGFVPKPLVREKDRGIGTVDQCPRAVKRLIADGDSTLAVWVDCDSRTCGHCRPFIDARDLDRIARSFDGETPYVATVPASSWDRVRKRAQRAGVVAVKMANPAGHELITVVSSSPVTSEAKPATPAQVADLVEHRPTWAPGRAMTSGPGLMTVKEWEQVQGREHTPAVPAESVDMHHSVDIEYIEAAAEVLRIEYRTGLNQIRLLAAWDDSRMVLLRRFVRDPNGTEEWSRMLAEAETAQGVRPMEEPPDELYHQIALGEMAA